MSAAKSPNGKPKSRASAPAAHVVPTRTNDIRASFLDFFAKNDHLVVPSAPLVPRHDPTLMFTNAGMVPFKNVFTGQEKPKAPRAASSQKCVRAGGKHNDLDNVGFTARHHTFFEMLGNFSFGDYFKERAILLAWELLTKEFALPAEKLLVTVYVDDDEAAKLWKKISGFPESKILRIAGSDNFWSMGDTGPCGPCSEIFYDHGAGIKGGPPGSADADGDRFVEIWNLVFMQYEQLAGGTRIDLPHPSIDTGMGLERIAAVMQGTHDNYAIDLFKTLIEASVELTGVPAEGENAPSHRIIADHLRASSFLIADGVLPSNEGRGYVLRRIMRRAMRHAHLLGASDPLLYRLVPTLVGEMGRAYHELERGQSLIEETLKLEETRFRETLERGLAPARRGAWKASSPATRFPARSPSSSTTPTASPTTSPRTRSRPRASASTRKASPRHGAPARRGAEVLGGLRRGGDRRIVVRAQRGARRHGVPRLRDRDRVWRDRGPRQGRQARR